MSAFQHRVALRTPPAPGWPPDDTEESVVGTNLHQATIWNLRLGLNEIAATLGDPAPWRALSQTGLSGLRRWDGTPLAVLPDIFVYDRPIDDRLAYLPLGSYGPPLLVAEVLSPTTYESNLDLEHGKGFSYARAGVQEYLVLDPVGEYVPEQIRGWRLHEGVYAPWQPDAAGRWQSEVIDAAVAFEGASITVYTRGGQRQLREGEAARAVARQRAEVARRDEEIAALRRLIEQLRPE